MNSVKTVRTPRRARRFALVVAAAAFSIGASGCAYFNDTQTHDFYQAADGVNVNPTGLGVRNAVLVTEGEKGATLYTTVVNTSDKAGTVTLRGSFEDAEVFNSRVEVPAGGTVTIGGQGDQQITVQDLTAKAGDMIDLTVSAPGQKDATSPMPVLDQSLAYYKTGASDGGSDGQKG